MTESSLKVLEKVKKLLALSTSANEAESAAASQKAHELLKEYNLSMADIPGEKIVEARYLDEEWSRARIWRTMLLYGVAHANYCEVLSERMNGMERQRIYGREYNIASVVAIFEYLTQAIDRIARSSGAPNKNSFRVGMADRLISRIKEAASGEGSCTALVLSRREAKEELRRANPQAYSGKFSPMGDLSSALMGRQAADDVPLNRQMRGGSRGRVAIA